MSIYHSVCSINITSTAHKIGKQVPYALKTLQDAFQRAPALEAGLQLAKDVHLGRYPQVMQVSTSMFCYQDRLQRCIHQVNV